MHIVYTYIWVYRILLFTNELDTDTQVFFFKYFTFNMTSKRNKVLSL